MRYRLVIFDFDGTLADSFPLFLRVVNGMADELAFKRIEAIELETLRGYSARQMVRYLKVPGWKMPELTITMRRRMGLEVSQIPLFKGVDTLLRRLSHQGVRLAIVTSNSEENVRCILGPENAALIDDYACGAAVFGKQAKLRKVLKRSGVAAHEAIYIGDEIRDIEAARRAGISFGGVAWGYTTVESLMSHAPSEMFATVDEIADRIA